MLIVAVWTISILSLLAIGAGYHAWLEMKLTSLELDRMKEQRLVLAAVELARGVLPDDLGKPITLKDPWADNATLFKEVRLDEGTFSVVRRVFPDDPDATTAYGLEDESGRISLNKAPKAALQALMGDDSDDAAQSILDWRQAIADDQRRKEVDSFYAELPHPYPCKHAPFESIDELLLVRGVDQARFARLRPWVTVFADRVNVNTAPKTVLTALGLSDDLADKIVEYRRSADAEDARPGAGVFANVSQITQNLETSLEDNAQLAAIQPLLGVGSRAFRLHVEVWPGDRPIAARRPARYEVVLEFKGSGEWAIKEAARE